MKKRTFSGIVAAMLTAVVLTTSCMGSWKVTKAVYKWNEKATDNKYVNNILFWVLHAPLPVYPLAVTVDYVVLNVIEFWTGANPLSMKAGEKETQVVMKNGKKVEITATKYRLDFKTLEGKDAGEVLSLVYSPADQSWNLLEGGASTKMFSTKLNGQVIYYRHDGTAFMKPSEFLCSNVH